LTKAANGYNDPPKNKGESIFFKTSFGLFITDSIISKLSSGLKFVVLISTLLRLYFKCKLIYNINQIEFILNYLLKIINI